MKINDEKILEDEEKIVPYVCRFLGCTKRKYKEKREDGVEEYGVIKLSFSGKRKDNEEPWSSEQEQYTSVAKMKEICGDIPFDSRCLARFQAGSTPGAKLRLVSLKQID